MLECARATVARLLVGGSTKGSLLETKIEWPEVGPKVVFRFSTLNLQSTAFFFCLRLAPRKSVDSIWNSPTSPTPSPVISYLTFSRLGLSPWVKNFSVAWSIRQLSASRSLRGILPSAAGDKPCAGPHGTRRSFCFWLERRASTQKVRARSRPACARGLLPQRLARRRFGFPQFFAPPSKF